MTYPDRLIDVRGPLECPTSSTNFTAIDCLLCEYDKSKIYDTHSKKTWDRIIKACAIVTQRKCQNVRYLFRYTQFSCQEVQEKYFEKRLGWFLCFLSIFGIHFMLLIFLCEVPYPRWPLATTVSIHTDWRDLVFTFFVRLTLWCTENWTRHVQHSSHPLNHYATTTTNH